MDTSFACELGAIRDDTLRRRVPLDPRRTVAELRELAARYFSADDVAEIEKSFGVPPR